MLWPNFTKGTNIILRQQKDWVGGQVQIFFVNLQYCIVNINASNSLFLKWFRAYSHLSYKREVTFTDG